VSASLAAPAARPPHRAWQASISASICAGVTRQRAASCTSTQSCARTPWASAAPGRSAHSSASRAPPQGTHSTVRRVGGVQKMSPGATTTSVPVSKRATPCKRGQRVQHHGLPGHHLVLLGLGRCRRAAAAGARNQGASPWRAGPAQTLPRQTLHPAPPRRLADSLLLARLAERDKAAGRTTAIVTADATDAQRLIDEMAFFAPGLRCALFPRLGNPALRHLLAAPGPDQRAPGHAVAHQPAGDRRRRGAGARHHRAVPAGATRPSWRATPSTSRSSKSSTRPSSRPSSRWPATAM
jgi:hypothetical protein